MTETLQPPYDGIDIPETFRQTPYEQLPQGIRRRVDAARVTEDVTS